MTATPQQLAFYNRMQPYFTAASSVCGIAPACMYGQAALETGYGLHAPNNNFFGIKGPGGKQATTEYIDGKKEDVEASFQGYDSLEDSMMGYAHFIAGNERYSEARKLSNVVAQIKAIAAAGYATDPSYAEKVISVAKGYYACANKPLPSYFSATEKFSL